MELPDDSEVNLVIEETTASRTKKEKLSWQSKAVLKFIESEVCSQYVFLSLA